MGKEEQEREKGRLDEVGWGWGKRRCVWDPIRSALHLLLSLPTTSFLFMAQGWLCSQAFVKGKLGNRSALHHAPGASQGLHCPLSGCRSYFSYPFFVPSVHIPCPPPFLLANTLVFHHLEWTDLLPAKETRAFLASRENKLRRSDIATSESWEWLCCSGCHSSLISVDRDIQNHFLVIGTWTCHRNHPLSQLYCLFLSQSDHFTGFEVVLRSRAFQAGTRSKQDSNHSQGRAHVNS